MLTTYVIIYKFNKIIKFIIKNKRPKIHLIKTIFYKVDKNKDQKHSHIIKNLFNIPKMMLVHRINNLCNIQIVIIQSLHLRILKIFNNLIFKFLILIIIII